MSESESLLVILACNVTYIENCGSFYSCFCSCQLLQPRLNIQIRDITPLKSKALKSDEVIN